ncbi:MAG: YhcH/YjgK/YiaL family protein [Prevotella sp.]
MRRQILFVLMLLSACLSVAQGYYTVDYGDKALTRKARQWVKKGEWRNGFMAAKPDKSVNITEFYRQYHKNPEQWNALFKWLSTNDLTQIAKGKYQIENTSLVVSVEDSKNSVLSKRKSESHYHKIDFQYVVKGVERFGIIDHLTSKPNCEYKPDVIHYDYDVSKTRFYDSAPDRFFIFFPSDWHIAKVKTDKEDQNIRVIVIKVDYVE